MLWIHSNNNCNDDLLNEIVNSFNLCRHLSSAKTTEQVSARFAYAAAMKSINNLLLGDGESWSRQSVDFSGLPEMARTFLQVAAGAADKGPMPMHRHGCPSR